MFSLFILCTGTLVYGQNPPSDIPKMGTLRVYLDCSFCDHSYIKQNSTDVMYVRDRTQADVHLLFTSQQSGSGGRSEKIQFLGLGVYKHLSDILSYSTTVNMSSDEIRQLRLRYIELGLMRYRIEAGQEDQIEFVIHSQDTAAKVEEEDPWNSWVYSMYAGARFNGQETSHFRNINGGGAAKRITESNKFILNAGYSQNHSRYVYDNDETIGIQRSAWVNAQDVVSINDHWSYGFFTNAGNSIFSNYRLYAVGKAGLEFDLFDYAESFNKQAIVAYNLGARYNNYYDTTVFNRLDDQLAFHELTIGGTVKENWGNFSSTVTYQNFLHDFSLNSISLWMNLKIRLFKGFSWRFNGSFNILNNQVNIASQGASKEDLLLQQQQLGSGYTYYMNTGINYSFGSMYNSVVNPRFQI
jgi:hypothetical protein